MKKKFKIDNISLLIAVVLLAAMYVAGARMYERFGSVSTILNLFNDNAYLIVVAVGMTFVLLTGGIDISVASTLAFTGVFSAYLLEKGWPAGIVIPLVLALGILVGCVLCVPDRSLFGHTGGTVFYARYVRGDQHRIHTDR